MNKEYTSLGLMSGTSGDGVDASIIQSDGNTKYRVLKDKYFEYDVGIYNNIHHLREKINNSKEKCRSLTTTIHVLNMINCVQGYEAIDINMHRYA